MCIKFFLIIFLLFVFNIFSLTRNELDEFKFKVVSSPCFKEKNKRINLWINDSLYIQETDFESAENLKNRLTFDLSIRNLSFLIDNLLILTQFKNELAQDKVKILCKKILDEIQEQISVCQKILKIDINLAEKIQWSISLDLNWIVNKIVNNRNFNKDDLMKDLNPFLELFSMYYDQKLNFVSYQGEAQDLFTYIGENCGKFYRVYNNSYDEKVSFDGELSAFASILYNPDYELARKVLALKKELNNMFFISSICNEKNLNERFKKEIIEKLKLININYLECNLTCQHIMNVEKSSVFFEPQLLGRIILEDIKLEINSENNKFLKVLNVFTELKDQVTFQSKLDKIDSISLSVNKNKKNCPPVLIQAFNFLFLYEKFVVEDEAVFLGLSDFDSISCSNSKEEKNNQSIEVIDFKCNKINYFSFAQSSCFFEPFNIRFFGKKMQVGVISLYAKDFLNLGVTLKTYLNDSFNAQVSLFQNGLFFFSISFNLFQNFSFLISVDHKNSNIFLSISYFINFDSLFLDLDLDLDLTFGYAVCK